MDKNFRKQLRERAYRDPDAAGLYVDACDARADRFITAFTHFGWWALIATIAAFAMCCAYPKPLAWNIRQQNEATLQILTVCPNGDAWLGSGVMTSPHMVLTAHHVSDHPGCSFVAATDEGKQFVLEIGARSWPDRDIGELYSKDPLPYVPVDWAPVPNGGDRVCVITGFPMRMRRCGDVQLYVTSKGYMVDLLVEPGNSGSPVVDERGRLVGIMHSTITCHGQFCAGMFSPVWGLK